MDRRTADFYSQLQYPGPKALVSRIWANRLKPFITEPRLTLLDAGCGSGRHTAGVLLTFPESSVVGIDISYPSLVQARALFDRLGLSDRVQLVQSSFSEPLGFRQKFDVVLAVGTIHCTADPMASMRNLADVLKTGGLLACMVYGQRGHFRRFEIKELLNLLAGNDWREMERLYEGYRRKYESWLDQTPRAMIKRVKTHLGILKHVLLGKRANAGYRHGFHTRDQRRIFFLDGYAAPVERSFTSHEIAQMLEQSGLELIEMLNLGRLDRKLLPRGWEKRWCSLGLWDKIRVSELLDPSPESFSFIARKTC